MTLTPRQYQLEGIDYLTTPNVVTTKIDFDLGKQPSCARHILSDAPGAGKTPQAIWAALKLLAEGQSCFIFAPAHLCPQWFQYFKDHFPEHEAVWLEGPASRRAKDATVKAKFYIMSIQSMRHKHYIELATQVFLKQHVRVAIIDESHYVKNPDAVSARSIRQLTRPEFCPHVILLSATPIVREADDLYMQLRICDPHTFHRQDIFMNTYCWFSYGAWKYTDVMLRKGAKDALKPWLWGRTYGEIGLELPPVIPNRDEERQVLVQLNSHDRKVYDDMKYYWQAQFSTSYSPDGEKQGLTVNSAMEAMHMLRHLTARDDKCAELSSYLTDDPGPYLIACAYRLSAQVLRTYIEKHHPDLQVKVIDGSIAADDRRQIAISSSQSSTSVIIATIASISEGVDLSHCNTVYTFEEDYTPGKMHQFLSRVRRHRQAQDTSVTITEDRQLVLEKDRNFVPIIMRHFICERTIDQRVHAVQSARSVNAKDIIKLELAL